jgi:hypothetical protein
MLTNRLFMRRSKLMACNLWTSTSNVSIFSLKMVMFCALHVFVFLNKTSNGFLW